jgi:hypothetical protein
MYYDGTVFAHAWLTIVLASAPLVGCNKDAPISPAPPPGDPAAPSSTREPMSPPSNKPAVNVPGFPPEYKTFPFKEGDLLSSQGGSGKFDINKVLKIDRVTVKKGGAISIQGQQFVLTEEDSLLVISCAYGNDQFSSLQEATAAARTGTWQVAIAHVPNRAPGAAAGQTLIGHQDVTSSELAGYQLWKTAFDQGTAGIF